MKNKIIMTVVCFIVIGSSTGCWFKKSKPDYELIENVTPPLFKNESHSPLKSDINLPSKFTWGGANFVDGNGFKNTLKKVGFILNIDQITLQKGYSFVSNDEKSILSIPYNHILLATEETPNNSDIKSIVSSTYIKLINIELDNSNGQLEDRKRIQDILDENFISYKCNPKEGEVHLDANISPRGEVLLLKKYRNLKIAT